MRANEGNDNFTSWIKYLLSIIIDIHKITRLTIHWASKDLIIIFIFKEEKGKQG